MNTRSLATSLKWQTTGIINGVKVRQIPVNGNACYYGCGSDSYGYEIANVSADGTEFDMLNDRGDVVSHAKLVTRKNSPLIGCYVQVDPRTGKLETWRDSHGLHGALAVTSEKGCGKTYLDPSF